MKVKQSSLLLDFHKTSEPKATAVNKKSFHSEDRTAGKNSKKNILYSTMRKRLTLDLVTNWTEGIYT